MGLSKFKIIVIGLLPVTYGFLYFIKDEPTLIEQWYSMGIYPVLSMVLRTLTGWLPFSVGEALIAAAILYVIFWLRKLWLQWRRKHFGTRKALLWGAAHALFAYSLIYGYFLLSWGFNYLRVPLYKQLDFELGAIHKVELQELNHDIIAKCNALRGEINLSEGELPISRDEILASAHLGYVSDFPLVTPEPTPIAVKPIFFTSIFSHLGIAGIYGMITGEANVNLDPPNFLIPFTACHEIAHQLGYAPEEEANYLGYLATQYHPNPLFQYSGSLAALRYTMRSMYWTDSLAYAELLGTIDSLVLSDLQVTRAYWNSFDNPIEVVTDIIYDYYLKANDQPAGIASYGLVVQLLVAQRRRESPEPPNNPR